MAQMNRRRYPLLGGLALLALLLALLFARAIGQSHIDVGLDLTRDVPTKAQLRWGQEGRQTVTMDKISEFYSPGRRFFSITALDEKNPASAGRDVIIKNFPYPAKLTLNPTGGWQKSAQGDLIAQGKRPCVLMYRGIDELPFIVLQKGPRAGRILLESVDRPQNIDLYAKHEGLVKFAGPKSNGTAQSRYHAFVPRSALADLRLQLDGAVPNQITRLYVGSILPSLFQTTPPAGGKYLTAKVLPLEFVANGRTSLPLPSYVHLETGGLLTVAILFVLLELAMLATYASCRWGVPYFFRLLRSEHAPRTLEPFNLKVFLSFFAVCAGCWLLYWLAFYPAGMSPDSTGQWAGLDKVGHVGFCEVCPLFHTLTLKALTLIWNHPAIVALAQIFAQAFVCAYAFSLLLCARVSKWIVIPAFLTVALSPRNSELVMTIWKDVPYTIAIFTAIIMLSMIILFDPRKLGKGYWIGLGVALALVTLYRHNGLLITLAMLPLLPLVLWRQWRRPLLASSVALGLILFTKLVLNPFFQAVPMKGYNTWLYATRAATLVYQDVPMPEQDYRFLDQVRTLARPWPYAIWMANQVVYGPLYNSSFALTHQQAFGRLDRSLLLRYPLVNFIHFARNMGFVWLPFLPGPDDIKCPSVGVSSNTLGIEMKPLSPALHDFLNRWTRLTMQKSVIWFMWRPALHLYASLLIAFLLLRKHRDIRFLLLFAPGWINTFSILVAAQSQDHRYQYPVTLPLAFLFCLLFVQKAAKPSAIPSPSAQEHEKTSCAVDVSV